jgi:hypothetical protein
MTRYGSGSDAAAHGLPARINIRAPIFTRYE